MSMVSAIISLLAALFNAIPSIKDVVSMALERADKANVAEAFSRESEKNARNAKRIEEILKNEDKTEGPQNEGD